MEECCQNDAVFNLKDCYVESWDGELSLCDLPIDTHQDHPPVKITTTIPQTSTCSSSSSTHITLKPPPPPNPSSSAEKRCPPLKPTLATQFDYYRPSLNGSFIRRNSFKTPQSLRSGSLKPPSAILNCVSFSKPSPVARKSAFRRRHKVLIGLAKLQPEMEMSEIRKRRSPPVSMLPAKTEARRMTVPGGGNVERVTNACGLRPFRHRFFVLRALTKASAGCMQHVWEFMSQRGWSTAQCFVAIYFDNLALFFFFFLL